MELEKHNATIFRCMEPGDMIEFKRGMYSHWGVCVGNGELVHLTGQNDGIGDYPGSAGILHTSCGSDLSKAQVVQEGFWSVVRESKAYINNSKDRKHSPLPPEEIVENAVKSIGTIGYNIVKNNCEHFAAMCRYGVSWSEQVESFLTWASVGSAIFAVGSILWALTRPKALTDKRK